MCMAMCLLLYTVAHHTCRYFWNISTLVPFFRLHYMIPCNIHFSPHSLLNTKDSWAWRATLLLIHFCVVPLPSASESPRREFDKSLISVCHLSEELL